MAKLPGFQTNPNTRSLGQVDIYAPVKMANAQASALENVASVIEEIDTNERRMDMERSQQGVEKTVLQFEAENRGRDTYSAKEVPPDIGIKLTEQVISPDGEVQTVPREEIPAYEVYPRLLKKTFENAVTAYGNNIRHAADRESWIAEMRNKVNARFVQAQTEARETQRLQQRKHQLSVLDVQLQQTDFAGAKETAKAFRGTKTERSDLLEQVELKQEVFGYDDAIRRDSLPDMKAALKRLTPDKYDGKLTPEGARIWAERLRAKIASHEARAAVSDQQEKRYVRWQLRKMVESLRKGDTALSPLEVRHVRNRAVELELDPGLITEADIELHSYADKRKVSLLPTAEQEAFIQQAGKIYKDGIVQTIAEEGLRNTARESNEQRRTDPWTWAVAKGAALPNVLDTFPSQNQFQQFAQRYKDYQGLKETYDDFPDKLLSPMEMQRHAAFIRDASEKEKLDYMANVNAAFKEDAGLLYDQLKATGAFVVAGSLHAQGEETTAAEILRGQELLKNPEFRKSLPQGKEAARLQDGIRVAIGGLFQRFGMDKPMVEAIRSVYAYRSMQTGIDLNVLDSELLDSVVRDVANVIEFNDTLIIAPTPGMTSDQFASWIKNIDPAYLDMLGGIEGMDSSEVLDMIEDGDIRLDSAGPGRFKLFNTQSGQYLTSADSIRYTGKPTGHSFTLQYDETAPTRLRSKKIKMYQEVLRTGKTAKQYNRRGRVSNEITPEKAKEALIRLGVPLPGGLDSVQ